MIDSSKEKIEIYEKIYPIYIEFLNENIGEDDLCKACLDAGINRLSDNELKYKSNKAIKIACGRYMNHYIKDILNEKLDTIDNLRKEKNKKASKRNKKNNNKHPHNKLEDEEIQEIIEKIYYDYLKYLNLEISEIELFNNAKEYGITRLYKKESISNSSMKKLLTEIVNYYSSKVLKINRFDFENIRHDSKLYKKINNNKKNNYNKNEIEILNDIYTNYGKYINLEISYEEFKNNIEKTNFNFLEPTLSNVLDIKLSRVELYSKIYATKILNLTNDYFEEIKYKSNIYKKSYKLCMDYCYRRISIDKIINFEERYNIDVKSYAEVYANKNGFKKEYEKALNINIKNTEIETIDKYKENINYSILYQIDNLENVDNIIDRIVKEQIDIRRLRINCFDYITIKYPKINTLDESKFTKLVNEMRRKVDMIIDTIKSEQVHINKSIFNSNLNREIEQLYDEKTDLIDLCEKIKYGINGTAYQIYDYYMTFGKIYNNFGNLLEKAKSNLDEYNYTIIENFIKNNINNCKGNDEILILNKKIVIANREITDEEKYQIINNMKNNKIPITMQLFRQACFRQIITDYRINNKKTR